MNTTIRPLRRRWLVPEVVQTSAMDCGPAALAALLTGCGVHVSYGRLREACQTDVDGTSIDTIEEVAGVLGLHAEQIMVPLDHLLLEQAHHARDRRRELAQRPNPFHRCVAHPCWPGAMHGSSAGSALAFAPPIP